MGEFFSFKPGASFLGDLFCQSTLFLIVGLAGSFALGRRPARAHLILLLAIAGSLITPLCSQIVYHAGIGLRTTEARHRAFPIAGVAKDTSAAATDQAGSDFRDENELRKKPFEFTRGKAKMERAETRIEETRSDAEGRLSAVRVARVGPFTLFIALWGMLSLLCLLRLGISLIVGWRTILAATKLSSAPMDLAVVAACDRLRLRVHPDLRTCSYTSTPAIWCWGRQPTIILPWVGDAWASIDWVGVFTHELAHWLRRDHLASLIAELLVCALPWHPLVWLAKHRRGQLSELACDDWAIAGGREPVVYAETLLTLMPRRRNLAAMAAVSRRIGLAERISRLMAMSGPIEPQLDRRWSSAIAVIALGLVALIALSQTREGRARSNETKRQAGEDQPIAGVTPAIPHSTRSAIRGTVRDVAGKPIAGASIFAVGLEHRQRANGWYFTHQGTDHRALGQTSTDRGGQFVLDLAVAPQVVTVELIARAAGMGLTGRTYGARADESGQSFFELLNDRPVELTLRSNVPIEGRLLSQAGKPVSGVSASLTAVERGESRTDGGFGIFKPEDAEGSGIPAPYWPEPVKTDDDGRFRLDGLSEKGVARVAFMHPAFVHEQLIVSTEPKLGEHWQAWPTKPAPPRFTHVLEPARPVEGIVTDSETGRPLAGIRIEMGIWVGHVSWPSTFPSITDAHGRYLIRGIAWHASNGLFAQILPDAASGYLAVQHHHENWPARASTLRWDFSLKKGAIVRGRVVDGVSRRPIAGARVVGERDNARTVTNEQGEFSLCIGPRSRSLFVDALSEEYQRVRVPSGEISSSDAVLRPHAYVKVRVKPDRIVEPIEIALHKGATITARAVDLEGKPLKTFWVAGESLFVSSGHYGGLSGRIADGLFRASSFAPDEMCRVFFIQDGGHLAGFADLTAKFEPRAPASITLRPVARVRGKLLKPDGAPNPQQSVSAYFLLGRTEGKLVPMNFLAKDRVLTFDSATRGRYRSSTKTNEEGAFEINDLVPGVRNYLVFGQPNSAELQYVSLDSFQPGEIRDLGMIKSMTLFMKSP